MTACSGVVQTMTGLTGHLTHSGANNLASMGLSLEPSQQNAKQLPVA